MSTVRKRVLLIENSVATTGAWVSGISMVRELVASCDLALLLPVQSVLKGDPALFKLGEYRLPMTQLGRSWRKVLAYGPRLLVDAWQLMRLLRRLEVDVLIVNDYYNLLGTVLRCMGWKGRIVTWVRLRPCKQNPHLNRLWVYAALRCSDVVAAVSETVKRDLPDRPHVCKIVNPHSLVERHPGLTPEPSGESGIRFLLPANYIAGKGHDQALSAFNMAYQRNPSMRLRFVGADMGLEKNRRYKQALQARVDALGLGHVVELGGFSSDMELEMKSAHVVMNLSESESFSNTCLEAGFFHRPVIATRCGGPEEIVEEGQTGFLVDLGDARQAAGRMLQLAADAALRQRMGEGAHERTARLFVNIDSTPMCEALLGECWRI
jgi:glycosyltransferase involved in cell wall biosynthesis